MASHRLVLNTNIWIFGLLQKEPYFQIIQAAFPAQPRLTLIIDSYGVVEILHALRNVSKRVHIPIATIEKAFWSILNKASCFLDFEHPIKNNLLEMMRSRAEYLIIARTFDLELKDVPYLVLSFKHNALLVTADERSLYSKRELIRDSLGVKILSIEDALDLIRND